MNSLAHVVGRFATATGLLASAYWVMFGSGELPWIISTILHLYAITAIGITALLLLQAGTRVVSIARHQPQPFT
ncbi:MAG: hypothetical protein O3C10_07625 [Chloroflexi bacterium]|nr:hypothetical protein [Chloroflexota bacterium]